MNYRFDWSVVWTHAGTLMYGAAATVAVFIPAAMLSILVGILIGAIKSSKDTIAGDLAQYYVNLFRNIPAIVILFFLYFVFKLPPYIAAVIGIALHRSAYIAEVTNSGIRSAARNMRVTALASGFTTLGAYRYIILPTAIRMIIPAITTHMIEILKATSVAMTLSFADLTYTVSVLSDTTYRGFELATAGTVLYGVMALIIAQIMSRVETRYRIRLQ